MLMSANVLRNYNFINIAIKSDKTKIPTCFVYYYLIPDTEICDNVDEKFLRVFNKGNPKSKGLFDFSINIFYNKFFHEILKIH